MSKGGCGQLASPVDTTFRLYPAVRLRCYYPTQAAGISCLNYFSSFLVSSNNLPTSALPSLPKVHSPHSSHRGPLKRPLSHITFELKTHPINSQWLLEEKLNSAMACKTRSLAPAHPSDHSSCHSSFPLCFPAALAFALQSLLHLSSSQWLFWLQGKLSPARILTWLDPHHLSFISDGICSRKSFLFHPEFPSWVTLHPIPLFYFVPSSFHY